MRVARYYPTARLAHIERLADDRLVDFFYSDHRLDWDESLASSMPNVRQQSAVHIIWSLLTTPYDLIEIPEPLAISLLPRLVLLTVLLRVKKTFGRKSPRFVFYAIENLDQVCKVAARTRFPSWLIRPIVRWSVTAVLSRTHRVAFGTQGARENYESVLSTARRSFASSTELADFEALPSPRHSYFEKGAADACFVGALDDRKGIRLVMAAWPLVVAMNAGSTLSILGHGPFEVEVRDFAQRHPEVSFCLNPSRKSIWEALGRSHCLILPSQRTVLWREQVGLPIVEGLSQGCEIVTTTETGIANWLRKHGHRLVDSGCSPETLATAIDGALSDKRPFSQILADLPETDSREQADAWLMQPEFYGHD